MSTCFSSFFFTRFSLKVAEVAAPVPHLSVNQDRLHLAWMKSQTVPTKILDIIKLCCSWPSNWPVSTHFSILRLLERPFLLCLLAKFAITLTKLDFFNRDFRDCLIEVAFSENFNHSNVCFLLFHYVCN